MSPPSNVQGARLSGDRFRVIAYSARHADALNALLNGVDPVSVSHLMGHRSPAMVTRVYSHLAQNHEFLWVQAKNAVQKLGEIKKEGEF